MKFNLRALAFAAAAFLAGSAHADINFQNTGNGTLLFVAIDADANIAFTADLGLTVGSFTESTTFTSGLAAPVTWNFATNATNAGIAGTNAWSAAYSAFVASQTGGNFQWGVIASDSVSSGVAGVSPNRRNTLSTGNPTVSNMLALTTSQTITNQQTPFSQFEASVNNFGNIAAANTNGAATTTSADGPAYLFGAGSVQGNFNGANTRSYLLANGVSSNFQRAAQVDNNVTQFGNPNAVDSLSASPITFTFDIATNSLTLAPAIPEPGTYALLLAGLGAVGFMARRRKA